MRTRPYQSTPDTLHRLCATASALVVFMLGLMSVSPTLHDWAHNQPCSETAEHSHEQDNPLSSDSEHSCAIVSFSTGVALAIDTAVLSGRPSEELRRTAAFSNELQLVTPRFRLPPGRAPPSV